MSTKTSFKRIALVAVAGLVSGLVSVAPANAAAAVPVTTTTLACEFADGGARTADATTCSGVAGVANRVTLGSQADATKTVLITVSGAGSAITGIANGTLGGTIATTNASILVAAATVANTEFFVSTPTAGTIVANSYLETAAGSGIFSATADKTVTITVNAAPVSGSIQTSTTTAALVAGATAGATADGPVTASSAPAAGVVAAGVVKVVLGQVAGAITGTTAVAASISGPGTLILDNNDGLASPISTGRSLTSTIATTGETFYVGVAPDGTSGVATVTITAGTYSVTKSVTFYGKATSLKATAKKNPVTGATTTGSIEVIAYDAANVVVPSEGLTITSGTTATIADFTATSSSAAQVTAGTASVDVTAVAAKFGPVVLTIKDTATKLVSTTVTVNVGAAEAKAVTAAFSKTSYTPGELVTLTISATDANGVAVGDTAAAVASSYTIVTNAAVQGTIPTDAEFKLGKQVITFYAPLVSGPLTADIKLGATAAFAAAIQGTTVKATSAVAQNADISAITTLINSLIAKINALNKLVIKIQKKVKA